MLIVDTVNEFKKNLTVFTHGARFLIVFLNFERREIQCPGTAD